MTSSEFYEAGQLTSAVEAARNEVAADPSNTPRRCAFWELLCFAGDWLEATEQLELLSRQDPDGAEPWRIYRQIMDAETLRQQVFQHGAQPEFPGGPTPTIQLQLQLLTAVREGRSTDAADLASQIETQRARVHGQCDGLHFQNFRDLDDLTASFLEVFTLSGKYFWVPLESLVSIEFRPATHPRDQLWRRARLVLSGGIDGEVLLPALYPLTFLSENDQLRLGRDSDWIGQEGEAVRGVGRRVLLIGDEDRPLLEMEQLRFDAPM